MPTPRVIRPACAADVPTIVAFNRALAEETEGRLLDATVLASGVAALLADAAKGQYFVGTQEGRVVGQLMITYEWSDWRNGVFWWIQSVYVDPEFRKQGVLRSLWNHVESLSRNDPQVCGIRLYMEHSNSRARSAYQCLGLKPAGYEVFEVDFKRR